MFRYNRFVIIVLSRVFSLILIAKIIVIIVSLRLNEALGGWQKLVNFHNRFDKALTEIFQFHRALAKLQNKLKHQK